MKLIILYGPPAVGKYTIAKAIAEKTGYKLFHNHLTVDLLKSVFDFGTPTFFQLNEKIRLDIFEQATKEDIPGIVFTLVYEKQEDDDFIRRLVERIESSGGTVVFIQLYGDEKELLKRVTEESRQQFRKLKSADALQKALTDRNLMSSIDFVHSTKIDSTHLTTDETVGKVLEIIEGQ